MISTPKVIEALKKEFWSVYSTEAHKDWDMLRYINSGVREICKARAWGFNKYAETIVVTSWQTEYTIPYQMQTFFVKDSEDSKVDFYKFEDYYDLSSRDDAMMIEDEKLVSTKTWTFTIYYRWFPPTITEANSSIWMPAHFFDLLVVIAAHFWFSDIRAYWKARERKDVFVWFIRDEAKSASDKQPRVTKRLNKNPNKQW